MEYETNQTQTGANGQDNMPSSSTKSNRLGSSRDFHSFLSDIENLITSTTSLTGEDLAKAKAKLNERIATAKASVDQMGGAIKGQARKTAEQTDLYVHQNSWTAIGIGAAAGFLLGVALARR